MFTKVIIEVISYGGNFMNILKQIQSYLIANKNRSIQAVYSDLCSKDHLSRAEVIILRYLKSNKKKLGIK